MLAAGKHFYLEGSMGLADNDGKPLWSWPSFHQTAQITPFLHLLTTTIRDGHFGPPCDPARVSAQLDSIAARTLEHHKPMQSPHVSYPRAPMHVRQQPRRAMHGFGHPPCPMPNAGPLEPWGAGHPGLQPHDRAEDMQTIAKMESDEDTLGSGIFDPIGRAPTDNANMGMFESHYSWPGYLARETPFAVSRDITDINGAAFVAVPSGGMPYVDRGMPKPYPILGPTPRPPSIGPTRDVTGRMQQYVSLNSGGHPRSTLNPNAPVRSMPTFQSERESNYWQRPASWPEGQEVQSYPAERPVYTMSSIQPYTPGVPVSGFGVDDPAATGPTKGQMIVAGALIGAATGILVSVFRSRS